MCGFLAEFTYTGTNVTEVSAFEMLLSLSTHRGPDFTETFKGEYYQLGFNRLAILDVSQLGNQPKRSPSGRYHVVFNGEIYNYKELEQNYQLKNLVSTSDTEVLVHMLDKLGVEKTISQLNGMFAMAIMDTNTDKMYLTRDFAGIKPLFYGVAKQGLVSASQFNQIFKHPWFRDNLNYRPEVIKEYFAFGYMQAPNTIFKSIYQINPGELLICDKKGNIKKQIIQSFDFLGLSNAKTNPQKLKQKVVKATQSQLVSHVPLGTFLSGGIDSPLITAVANEHKNNVTAFTLEVEHKDLNESHVAKAYAKNLKVKHTIESIQTDNLLHIIDEHFQKFSEPFGDYSSIPTFLISKKAKKQFTVMLSGDGGDELFWGYPRFWDVYRKRHWFSVPLKTRKPIIRLLNKLKLIHTWAPYNYKNLTDFIRGKHSHINPDKLNNIFEDISFSKEFNELYGSINTTSRTSLWKGMRWNEFYGHMQRVLIKVDRMSMANSMEVRVPFLDKEVIEEALKLDPKSIRKPEDLKRTLKDMLADYIPKNIIFQQKKGFAVPMESWLKSELKADVKSVIFDKPIYGNEIIKQKELRQYVKDFYLDKHNSAWGVWHIYAWQKWALKEKLI
ncbi:asparagine synthase (glutamine-hydrolyzing) [Hanstruepera marina]|uniref:asparagine synthase (glutamine-hydrolyzing) n=1 Tax=Hanstruepera marina TaxID=2873265 RepID=UPI001CA62B89|nr:asparagine synthase (glutamine-hydrolyzing) [Hanstruepera marina]